MRANSRESMQKTDRFLKRQAETQQSKRECDAAHESAKASRVELGRILASDEGKFATVNEIMAERFRAPYPARSTIGVASLPRGAQVEIDAILHLAP